jgi:putative cell wall-binding protein
MHAAARRRSWTVVSLAALLFAALLAAAPSGSAAAGFAFKRYAGTDRNDTARLIAADTFGTSDIVIITSGTSYPDALAASYAAGLGGVPILLVAGDTIPAGTNQAIASLGATKALIVGGTNAVSTAAENAIKAKGLSTTRIAGTTRYDTAAKVAQSGGAAAVGKTGGAPVGGVGANPTAIVVSGEGFADALSAGPMAYAGKFPVLLTPSASLAPEAKAALTALAIKNVFVVGGTAAVSAATEKAITDMGITVTRIAGNGRNETATKVADYELANLGFSTSHVDLARGDAFPDALSASTHGGKVKAPLLLTATPSDVSAPTRSWLAGHASNLKDGHIDGGTTAVTQSAENDATGAATTGTTSTTTTNPTGTLLTTTTTAPGSSTTTTNPLTTLLTTTTTTAGSSTTTSSTTTTTPTSQLQQCPPGQTGPGAPFCFPSTSTPSKPAFVSAAASATPTPSITLTYNEAVACNTVDANGSDYTVVLDGNVITATASCLGTSSTTIRLTPSTAPVAGDGGTVTAKAGGDGDTVKDANAKPQDVGDQVSYSIQASAGPTFTGAGSTVGSSTLTVNYDQTLDCSTVDADGSDYTISVTSGPAVNPSITPSAATCSGKTVTLALPTGGAFQSGQQGRVTAKNGTDTNTVKNYAGQSQATGDFATYTIA